MLERRIEMKAGRELDALVAEKVIDRKIRMLNEVTNNTFKPEYDKLVIDEGEGRYNLIPRYSTNISDAWQVVEKLDHNVMLEKFNTFTLDFNNAKQTEKYEHRATVWCEGHRGISYEAETAPLAICLASLRAKGVDIE
jgi:hypothetical protein